MYTAPSMIVVDQTSRAMFDFDDVGVRWGRMLFLVWLWLCAVVVGRAATGQVRWKLHNASYGALAIASLVLFVMLFDNGYLFAYLGLENAIAGSAASVVALLGAPFLKTMLGVHALAFATRRTGRMVAAGYFLVTLVFVFASGVRHYQLIGVVLLLCLLRATGARPSLRLAGIAAGVTLTLLVLVVAYRNAQSIDPDQLRRAPIAALTSTDGGAVNQTLANLSTRLWYGPQFFAVVSHYLSNGAAFSDTWKEGFINFVPTALFPDKAVAAYDHAIEFELYQTGRFQRVDLSPTPWLHALFDYGVLGLIGFAILYALALRWLDRALLTRPVTWARWFVFSSIVYALALPEAKLDAVVGELREPLLIAALLVVTETLLRSIEPSRVARRPLARLEPG